MSARKVVALALLVVLAVVILPPTATSADREGAQKYLFDPNRSISAKLNDDLAVHRRGALAWATFTLAIDLVSKEGSSLHLNARWTMVLEKRAKGWIVVHEHVSVPLGGS